MNSFIFFLFLVKSTWYIWVCFLFIHAKGYSFPFDTTASTGSLSKSFLSFRSSLSVSYIIQKNFNQNDHRDFQFLGNTDFYYKVTQEKFIQTYKAKANLGYLKYIDSIWYKYSDGWRMKVLFNENETKTITHAYALEINSQFLNTYKYKQDGPEKYSKQWRGGFFNPATISFSYNISMDIWENSNVMLGLSSIRITLKPRYEGAIEQKYPFVKTSNAFILASYGISGQVNIYSQKIADNIVWDNTSSFFANGINRQQAGFDCQNTITFKFLKYLQFRFDTHIIYDPLTSARLQYDQGFLVGAFIEKRK